MRKEGLQELHISEIAHPEICKINVYPTAEEASKAAAREIVRLVQTKPEARITYATGDTMIPVYHNLVKASVEGIADFTKSTAFHLDEYYPCGPDEPHGFVKFLRERVFEPLGIKNTNELNGLAENPDKEAERYNRLLKLQSIDLAILGVGPWSDETKRGCHIAFNESGTNFDCVVHCTQLDPVTVKRDMEERGQDSPDKALTQGIANIQEANKIILIAYGKGKGESLRQALYGDIDIQKPASALRLVGQKVEMFIDEAAASELIK
jgi:glucosamine-6-phosphate deaminase